MPRENRNTMSVRNPQSAQRMPDGTSDSYGRRGFSCRSKARRLSVKEASHYTGLSCSTLNKLRCTSGQGPRFAKIGRRVLYDIADLDTWLARHLKTSNSGLCTLGMDCSIRSPME